MRQLWNPARKNSGEKAGHSELDNLLPHSRLHLSHGDIWQNKLSVLITMTAIHRAPCSVSVSATVLFIPFQRHPATLAILIRLIHNFEDRLNLLALFLSSFPFQIIRGSENCGYSVNIFGTRRFGMTTFMLERPVHGTRRDWSQREAFV